MCTQSRHHYDALLQYLARISSRWMLERALHFPYHPALADSLPLPKPQGNFGQHSWRLVHTHPRAAALDSWGLYAAALGTLLRVLLRSLASYAPRLVRAVEASGPMTAPSHHPCCQTKRCHMRLIKYSGDSKVRQASDDDHVVSHLLVKAFRITCIVASVLDSLEFAIDSTLTTFNAFARFFLDSFFFTFFLPHIESARWPQRSQRKEEEKTGLGCRQTPVKTPNSLAKV